MPLITNSLKGRDTDTHTHRHTDTHTQTHTHTHTHTHNTDMKKQFLEIRCPLACGWHMPGSEIRSKDVYPI